VPKASFWRPFYFLIITFCQKG